MLWEHVLTYYPNKYGCQVYKARNFHDLLFEVVMETNPESECENNEKVVAYRAFWVGDDVICTWSFYDDLDSEELLKDSEAFDLFAGQTFFSEKGTEGTLEKELEHKP